VDWLASKSKLKELEKRKKKIKDDKEKLNNTGKIINMERIRTKTT
jgi:hypothetical protein